MRRVGIYDQVKSAIQDILAPELHALLADVQRLDQKIDGLDQKMGYMKGEIVAEIRRVDSRIDGIDARIEGVERELRIAIDVRERLAALTITIAFVRPSAGDVVAVLTGPGGAPAPRGRMLPSWHHGATSLTGNNCLRRSGISST